MDAGRRGAPAVIYFGIALLGIGVWITVWSLMGGDR
jgi:hypothetical protein